MSVWAAVVGQEHVVAELQRTVAAAALATGVERTAADRSAMTHAWLFTGPPGSGRSVLATAFAAALQCPDQGCAGCAMCRQVVAGSHPDSRAMRAEGLSYGVDDVRDLVLWAATRPAAGQWRTAVIEDADRFTDQAANALLKSLEEPPPRMVWMLCAPSAEDVLPTIRSRCRHIALGTPTVAAVAAFLQERSGVDASLAAMAARASQGHVGRAKALVDSEEFRSRRREVLAAVHEVESLAACFVVAENLVKAAQEVADEQAKRRDEAEVEELLAGYGAGTTGVRKAKVEFLARGALKELRDAQDKRRKRVVRDELDRDLVDLLGYLRDVLAIQMGSDVELINAEEWARLAELARRSTPQQTLRKMNAVAEARIALDSNVTPLVAIEAMTVGLTGHPVG